MSEFGELDLEETADMYEEAKPKLEPPLRFEPTSGNLDDCYICGRRFQLNHRDFKPISIRRKKYMLSIHDLCRRIHCQEK